MAAPIGSYVLISDLLGEVAIPEKGILSHTLHNDDHVKVVLFGFAAGQELTAHTAPMPAMLHFLQGEATLTLGEETTDVRAGAFAHMPPFLNHAIVAKTPLLMLLLMVKAARQDRPGKDSRGTGA